MLKNASEVTLVPKNIIFLKTLDFVQSFVECKVSLADGTFWSQRSSPEHLQEEGQEDQPVRAAKDHDEEHGLEEDLEHVRRKQRQGRDPDQRGHGALEDRAAHLLHRVRHARFRVLALAGSDVRVRHVGREVDGEAYAHDDPATVERWSKHNVDECINRNRSINLKR